MRHHVLSEENLDIMNEIWGRQGASVNVVWAALNAARRKKVRRTTIQVQMRRLEHYGWLSRRKAGREFVYAPLWSRDETVADLLRSLRRRLFRGSHAEMVRVLLADGDLTEKERRRIRALLRGGPGPKSPVL
jgi:BlaI family transcriptional regulator, penicillinase repressor